MNKPEWLALRFSGKLRDERSVTANHVNCLMLAGRKRDVILTSQTDVDLPLDTLDLQSHC